jgi:hypothetical protein
LRVVVAALVLFGGVITLAPAGHVAAATIVVDQCNGDNTGAAREIRCDTTVVNTLDIATGVTSSTVTTTVCAGAPGAALCVTTPGAQTSDIVNSVTQCNGSVNAGGSIVTCNVTIVNNVTGLGSPTPATVNQCIGSGQGGGAEPTTICAPATSVSGADVTQCNGSGNNGGATGRVTCTVPTSTVTALWPVTINQCNGSANGGGDLVTCTAQITSNILAPAATPTTTTGVSAPTSTVAQPGASTVPPGGSATPPGGATVPPGGSTTNEVPTPPGGLPATGGSATGFAVALLLLAAGCSALYVSRRGRPQTM